MHTEPVVVERHRRTGHVSDMLWMMMMMTMTVNENHSSWRIFHCDWIGAVNVTTMVVTTAVNIVPYICALDKGRVPLRCPLNSLIFRECCVIPGAVCQMLLQLRWVAFEAMLSPLATASCHLRSQTVDTVWKHVYTACTVFRDELALLHGLQLQLMPGCLSYRNGDSAALWALVVLEDTIANWRFKLKQFYCTCVVYRDSRTFIDCFTTFSVFLFCFCI